ncbi:hypothetical protein EES40_13265 [Streptomyces sp. ADI93-02]|nr:hypothetical protein EES40_13265 [Streptomyces sp. ADI93-02]
MGCLAEREDGGHAGVRPLEDLGPLGSCTGGEPFGDQGAQFLPASEVVAVGGLVPDPEEPGELLVETRLQCPDRHVLAVGGRVGAVEGAAAVQEVGAAPVLPAAGRQHAVDHRGEMGRAVDDGGVDDLSGPAGRTGVLEGGEHADDEVERAARVVADQIGGHGGRLTGSADHGQGAGEGDVADVVTCPLGQRPVLAPAGHPPVDEPRVALQAGVGAYAEAFGDPRAVALDQDVGALDEVEDLPGSALGLQVDEDRPLVAVGEVEGGFDADHRASRPVDAHHVGAEVGEEHRGERTRADARQFDDAHSGQRALRSASCRCHQAPSGVTQLM